MRKGKAKLEGTDARHRSDRRPVHMATSSEHPISVDDKTINVSEQSARWDPAVHPKKIRQNKTDQYQFFKDLPGKLEFHDSDLSGWDPTMGKMDAWTPVMKAFLTKNSSHKAELLDLVKCLELIRYLRELVIPKDAAGGHLPPCHEACARICLRLTTYEGQARENFRIGLFRASVFVYMLSAPNEYLQPLEKPSLKDVVGSTVDEALGFLFTKHGDVYRDYVKYIRRNYSPNDFHMCKFLLYDLDTPVSPITDAQEDEKFQKALAAVKSAHAAQKAKRNRESDRKRGSAPNTFDEAALEPYEPFIFDNDINRIVKLAEKQRPKTSHEKSELQEKVSRNRFERECVFALFPQRESCLTRKLLEPCHWSWYKVVDLVKPRCPNHRPKLHELIECVEAMEEFENRLCPRDNAENKLGRPENEDKSCADHYSQLCGFQTLAQNLLWISGIDGLVRQINTDWSSTDYQDKGILGRSLDEAHKAAGLLCPGK